MNGDFNAHASIQDYGKEFAQKIEFVCSACGSPTCSSSSGTAPRRSTFSVVLLRYNLKSVRAYLLKEDFQQFWDYESPTWAGKFLDQWCTQMRSRIEPMKQLARTLRSHRELLLNYFRARKAFSSGVIEGLNNKAKVTMRKSYGFRTFR
ncbi:MAG: transposase [Pseudomonadota bacterium]|nr:transposase [Pseudomonadota bacterium]